MGSAEAKPIMLWGRRSMAMTRRNIGEVEDVLVMVMVMVANNVGKIR